MHIAFQIATYLAIMAIKHTRSANGEMTVEDFKEWLKNFDKDKDGRISRDELRDAIRSKGGRFTTWKSSRGIRHADSNRNGFIDDAEIDNLVAFAQKHLGMKIVPY
ncbi:calmodulin-1-like [Phoenix dactylifera]|uniref:Calmodulin-1-like n=1 Tax=Phoenix dactylifera TaxID=42345 RepID=A0A8B8J188_PHODC|nr:calmodulin-1-like [Phoenix dactylifera]